MSDDIYTYSSMVGTWLISAFLGYVHISSFPLEDYPMSASLSTEKTSFGSRAKLVLTVFSFIGLGNFTASIVYVILISAFDGPIHRNINHLEWVWRLLLGLGTIPAALTIYARFKMKETKPYEKCRSHLVH